MAIALKKIKITKELLIDIDLLLLIEESISGGIRFAIYCYDKHER